MFGHKKERTEWMTGVYLCTAASGIEAEIIESKLRSENIPCAKKCEGDSNFMEVIMGSNMILPIDIYVPAEALEDAKNIIVAVPLEDCEPVEFED